MKKTAILLSTILLTGLAHAGQSAPQAMVAKKTIKAFGGQLKGALVTAMKAGGPMNAVSACNLKAPQIAEQINMESSAHISRTSLKNRNPGNAPNEWQRGVLLKFEERKAAGEDVAKMEYSEVVGEEFRYMKPIGTAEICLKCHGSNLDPKLTAKLDQLYPGDKARGFKKGDIRGAFYVVMPK
jgi:hypothetical protein